MIGSFLNSCFLILAGHAGFLIVDGPLQLMVPLQRKIPLFTIRKTVYNGVYSKARAVR